jgi:hypothetical protein
VIILHLDLEYPPLHLAPLLYQVLFVVLDVIFDLIGKVEQLLDLFLPFHKPFDSLGGADPVALAVIQPRFLQLHRAQLVFALYQLAESLYFVRISVFAGRFEQRLRVLFL